MECKIPVSGPGWGARNPETGRLMVPVGHFTWNKLRHC